MLINTKNLDKNKEIVKETKDRLSDLEERIKKMSKTEKKIKMLMRHQRLLKKFFIVIKMFKKCLGLHQKLIKENQNQRLKKVLQVLKLRRQKLDIIAKKKKKEKINNTLLEIMFKKLRDASNEKN